MTNGESKEVSEIRADVIALDVGKPSEHYTLRIRKDNVVIRAFICDSKEQAELICSRINTDVEKVVDKLHEEILKEKDTFRTPEYERGLHAGKLYALEELLKRLKEGK